MTPGLLRHVDKWLAPLKRRVRLMVARGVVKWVDDAAGLQRVQLALLAGELVDGAEHVQHYGLTSRPFADATAAVVFVGGSRSYPLVIAVDDRRYRLKPLAEGEVALYTDEGDKIHLKRNGNIEVTASTKFKVIAPTVELSGNLVVAGSVADGAGTMQEMRDTYNTHTHTDPQGGVTGGPSAQMT